MKKIIISFVCIICLIASASAETVSLEDRITALEARIAALEKLLLGVAATSGEDADDSVPEFILPQKDSGYVEGAVWYYDAEKNIVLECVDIYYNNINRGQIVLKFTAKNKSEHKVKFSAYNVYIDNWLLTTGTNITALDELAPQSNMISTIQFTDLVDGRIYGIEKLEDIGQVKEISFELVVRIDGRETDRIPVTITDFSTMEEKGGW